MVTVLLTHCVPVTLRDPERVWEGHTVLVGQGDVEREALAHRVGEVEKEVVAEPQAVALPLCETEVEAHWDGLRVPVGHREGERETDWVEDVVPLPQVVGEDVAQREGEPELLELSVEHCVLVVLPEVEWEGQPVGVEEVERTLRVGSFEGETLDVGLTEVDRQSEGEGLDVGLTEEDRQSVGEGLRVLVEASYGQSRRMRARMSCR